MEIDAGPLNALRESVNAGLAESSRSRAASTDHQ
jgi:hypothetical protein